MLGSSKPCKADVWTLSGCGPWRLSIRQLRIDIFWNRPYWMAWGKCRRTGHLIARCKVGLHLPSGQLEGPFHLAGQEPGAQRAEGHESDT
jgi:hypothetical protein